MLREEHILGEIFAYRYVVEDPKYALVISHGIASHAGIYDKFCTHHAARGAEIWSFDAPGHGRSTTTRPRGQWMLAECVDACVAYGEHARAVSGLPVWALGSSMGVASAYSALYCEALSGAVLMGSPAVPSTPAMMKAGVPWRSDDVQAILQTSGRALRLDCGILFDFDKDYGYDGATEQKRLDPWNTWTYDLASWASLFTYDPPIPVSQNRKPILVASGANDPSYPPALMREIAASIAGPVEYFCLDGGKHQLMLFNTEEFSQEIHNWIMRHVENKGGR